jgi:hypothetical protein
MAETKNTYGALEIRCLPEGGYVVGNRGAYSINSDSYNGFEPLAAFNKLPDAVTWINIHMLVREPFNEPAP